MMKKFQLMVAWLSCFGGVAKKNIMKESFCWSKGAHLMDAWMRKKDSGTLRGTTIVT